MLRSISGLERCEITRPGFLIEYDYILPVQLQNSLESKYINNLFFAGQINGTTGYEEAAAQGLVAGINASLKVLGEGAFILKRSESYIGLLIHDLVGQNIIEPYRMFTSRSEHKLLLNGESSHFRLLKYIKKLPLLKKPALRRIENDNKIIQHEFYFRKNSSNLSNFQYQNNYSSFIKNSINYKLKYNSYLSREQNIILKLNVSRCSLDLDEVSYLKLRNIKAENLNKTILNRPKSLADLLNLNFNNISDVKILIGALK
jgi:tRNA uridine 5-carboxymethylaminomethyl modification enzyme